MSEGAYRWVSSCAVCRAWGHIGTPYLATACERRHYVAAQVALVHFAWKTEIDCLDIIHVVMMARLLESAANAKSTRSEGSTGFLLKSQHAIGTPIHQYTPCHVVAPGHGW